MVCHLINVQCNMIYAVLCIGCNCGIGCASLIAQFKGLFRLLRPQHSTSSIWTKRTGNSRARLMCCISVLNSMLLPLPRRLRSAFTRPLSVCLLVSLSVSNFTRKTTDRVFMKILPKMYLRMWKIPLNSGSYPLLDLGPDSQTILR